MAWQIVFGPHLNPGCVPLARGPKWAADVVVLAFVAGVQEGEVRSRVDLPRFVVGRVGCCAVQTVGDGCRDTNRGFATDVASGIGVVEAVRVASTDAASARQGLPVRDIMVWSVVQCLSLIQEGRGCERQGG